MKAPFRKNRAGSQKASNASYRKRSRRKKLRRPAPSAAQDLDLIKKQFKKRKTEIPAYSQVKRYAADPSQGLTAEQVNERFTQFLFNDTNQKYSKSYASIFISNLCTFFNLLCVLAAAALIYSGAGLSQFLFVLIFALNLSFGIAMEIKAKRKNR